MHLLTISNLYPRPDRPTLGMFNWQLFRELAGLGHTVQNICLVPEWRAWTWARIRTWSMPDDAAATRYVPYLHIPVIGRNMAHVMAEFGSNEVSGYGGVGVVECGGVGAVECGGSGVAEYGGDEDERHSHTPLLPHSHTPILPHSHTPSLPHSAVLASWLYPDGVVGARIARESGRPLWLMVLGSDVYHLNSPVRRRVILDACRQARGIICVAQHLADRMIEAGVEPAKVHVVPNGVDTEMFHFVDRSAAAEQLRQHDCLAPCRSGFKPRTPNPNAACSRRKAAPTGHGEKDAFLPWLAAKHRLLFVGNLVPVKGPDVVLEAFHKLQSGKVTELQGDRVAEPGRQSTVHSPQSTAHSSRLLFIGSGTMEKELRATAERLGISDEVTFVGSRPHDELPLWMNAADVLVMGSRSEGMPNVMLEAMACGLPVVATDVGACRRMAAGAECVRVVPSGDSSAIATAADQLLARSSDRAAQVRRSDIRTWRTMAGDMLELMK